MFGSNLFQVFLTPNFSYLTFMCPCIVKLGKVVNQLDATQGFYSVFLTQHVSASVYQSSGVQYGRLRYMISSTEMRYKTVRFGVVVMCVEV
jgi:hypothetical protein